MRPGTLQALLALLAACCGSLLVLQHETFADSLLTARRAGRRPPAAAAHGAGPVHRVVLDLRRGQALEVVLEQRGSDVALRLLDPGANTVLEVDSPNGSRGSERLLVVAERSGSFVLEIALQPLAPPAGFRKRLVAVRPATAADRRLAAAELDFHAGERARRRKDPRSLRVARAHYGRALRAQLAVPDPAAAARSAARLGQVHALLDAFPEALAATSQALELGLADRDDRLGAINRRGWLQHQLGSPAEAIRTLAASPALAAPGSEPLYEAAVHNNLALAYWSLGETDQAVRRFERAAATWRRQGRRADEALALANLGELYVDLALPRRALAVLERALALSGQQTLDRVPLLRGMGMAHERLGDRESALRTYRRALELARAWGDGSRQALVLNAFGGLAFRDGRPLQALAFHRQALRLAVASRDLRNQANALASLAHISDRLGREREALPLFARARLLYQRLGDRSAEAAVLHGRALAERDLGRLESAREAVETALAHLEALRLQVPADLLRSSFMASRFDPYELHVDLLMQLHRQSPGAGFDAAAFAAAERVRARAITPRARDLREIQRELRGEDTLLLAYFLGEERSFAWRVDGRELAGYQLPGRAEIEAIARGAHRLLRRSAAPNARAEARAVLAALAARILAPVAGGVPYKRLLVVPDGALAAVPFAVLPDPAAQGEPLLVRHEVIGLPAASWLADLRRRGSERAASDRLVAVVADPVFGPGDPRLGPRAGPAPPAPAALARTVAELGLDGLERLPFSGLEAERILALAPPGSGRRLVGFDASRQAVLGAALERYRIVHFATHGLVHSDPELSGVVLSLVDRRGAPRDGLLRARELAGMELPAELVVLSACHTAAGTELRGEGTLSLSRAALQAGARRALVSLWAADDRATAELMTIFYRGLLREGLSPAAALRRAQLALRGRRQWNAPYYWAGFVLQGEPRAMAVSSTN